jgi:hypothetical protein
MIIIPFHRPAPKEKFILQDGGARSNNFHRTSRRRVQISGPELAEETARDRSGKDKEREQFLGLTTARA